MTSAKSSYDVAVVGGGHNGLVSAAYLARAGLSVLVLERRTHVGGAATHAAVTGLPDALVASLGLDVRLEPVAGAPRQPDAWQDLARTIRPTLLAPLPLERDVRGRVDPAAWSELVTTPLGDALGRHPADAAAALLGSSVSLHDPSLVQNRAFLHHLVHEWRTPAGGPGAVVDALARAATDAGAEIVTSAGVSRIAAGGDAAEVTWHDGTSFHTAGARVVLADVAPWVLRILLGEDEEPETKPEGAQVTVTVQLDGPTGLRSPLDLATDPPALEQAYAEAQAGRIPDPIPGVVRGVGDAFVFTGLHTPARLFEQDPGTARRVVADRVLAALGALLPTSVPRDRVRVSLPQDVEHELAMPGGHYFHGGPEWPWAANRARLDTPAQQWGVQTGVDPVLLCGAGSRRGGGVTGLGGHSAAHAVLAAL
jgi:phytoene dehydrogenase-like protein